jgi:DNA-binding YbaB/EbfC family protein
MTAGGAPDMAQLLMQAQKMQQDILAAQDALATAQVTGTAGGGLVEATMSGAGELIGLKISPEAVDPEDTETLADLILAAYRDGNRAVGDLQAQTMGPLTAGIGGLEGFGGGFDELLGGGMGGGAGGDAPFGLPPGR